MPVPDGFAGAAHVGLTADGVSRLYFSVGTSVFRYTPADQRVVPVSSGFAFVGGHTNTLTLNTFGNLWIGDDTTDGTLNFTGKPRCIARVNSISIQLQKFDVRLQHPGWIAFKGQ